MRKIGSSLEKPDTIQEGEIVDTEWDIKKIAVGIFVLVLFFIATSYVLFPNSDLSPSESTLGASTRATQAPPKLPTSEDVQGIITSAQATLSKITSDNLTSSQAAIQKVIADLEGLQGKDGAADLFCNLVCKK